MTQYPSVGSPMFYGIFFIAVLIMIAIDMVSLKKNGAHKVSIKEALAWSGIWVAVSCAFAGWLYFELAGNPAYGVVVAKEKVLEFFTGYVLEKSLAVDNIFVFLMIFGYFKVEPKFQHRVLLYGVFGAIVLRALAKDATGIWDVTAGRRILVAPNVLADAQRYALDQTDWCRWVSLCTGLRGVHLTHAPHLVPYVADLMRALPERSDELVRIVLLLDALPTAEMEVLTPKDLPSIQWLRAHRAHAGGVALVRACAAAGMPLAGVEALQAQTEGFARTVVREGAVAALLSGVEALPTASEYASPTTWLARVR